MGINVRMRCIPKQSEIIVARASLEQDLRSCMRCRFFYGNNRQCLASKCVREEGRSKIAAAERESRCFGCLYRQSEKYCFPCMKELLGRKTEHEKNMEEEQGGKTD